MCNCKEKKVKEDIKSLKEKIQGLENELKKALSLTKPSKDSDVDLTFKD